MRISLGIKMMVSIKIMMMRRMMAMMKMKMSMFFSLKMSNLHACRWPASVLRYFQMRKLSSPYYHQWKTDKTGEVRSCHMKFGTSIVWSETISWNGRYFQIWSPSCIIYLWPDFQNINPIDSWIFVNTEKDCLQNITVPNELVFKLLSHRWTHIMIAQYEWHQFKLFSHRLGISFTHLLPMFLQFLGKNIGKRIFAFIVPIFMHFPGDGGGGACLEYHILWIAAWLMIFNDDDNVNDDNDYKMMTMSMLVMTMTKWWQCEWWWLQWWWCQSEWWWWRLRRRTTSSCQRRRALPSLSTNSSSLISNKVTIMRRMVMIMMIMIKPIIMMMMVIITDGHIFGCFT